MVDKDLEALLIDKLNGNYTAATLRSALDEALASATIAKKREDEKNKAIEKWYDAIIAHLDTESLSFADAGFVAALAYAKRHPEADLVTLTNVATNVGSYAASQEPLLPKAPIGNTGWKITVGGDAVRKFLEENGW